MNADVVTALASRLADTPATVDTTEILSTAPSASYTDASALLLGQAERQTRNDPGRALHLAQRARDVSASADNYPLYAACVRAVGHAQRALGHHGQSLDHYEQAVQLFRAARLPVEAARTRLGTLDALMNLGRTAEALALGRRLRRVFARHNDTLNLAKLEANLANIHARLYRPRRALDLADAAAASFALVGEDLLVAQVNVNRANIFADLGEFRPALEAYEAAHAAFATHEMRSWMARIDVNVGAIYAAQGYYNRALRIISAARDVFVTLDSQPDRAGADLYLAEVYLALNMGAEAGRLAAAALATFSVEEMRPDMARALLVEARALGMSRDRASAALPLLDRATQLFAEEGALVSVAVVELYQASLLLGSDPDRALTHVMAATPVLARQGLVVEHGQSLLVKARAQEQRGAHRSARAAVAAAQRLGERYGLPWLTAAALHGAGRLRERYDPAGALRAYEAAIALIESMRAELQPEDVRISFVSGRQAPYEDLLRLLLQLDTDPLHAAAFALVERARSRTLLDLLSGNLEVAFGEPTTDPVRARLYARIRALREELNGHLSLIHDRYDDAHERRSRVPRREALRKARGIEDELQGLIRHARLLDADGTPLPARGAVDLATVQSHLAPDQALVEYAVAGDEILAFVIGRERVELARGLCSVREVDQLVERLHVGLQRFSYGEEWVAQHSDLLRSTTDHHLDQLGSALLLPLMSTLSGYRSLVIVPHGSLHYVPFHALRCASGYLLDTHETVVSPSASVWAACRLRLHAMPEPSVLTGLVLGVDDRHTPWMVHEAQTVGRLVPGARVATGDQATLATLVSEAPTCDLLHMACHGLFRGDNPLFSALRSCVRSAQVE